MGRPRHFNDASVAERIQAERLAFFAGIKDRDVLRLAASHHPSKQPCSFFRSAICGSYNICYFVEFAATGERWTVRIPIPPCLAHGGRSKLASEVATMEYLEEHADIPIPTVRAYSLDGADSSLPRYLILDYVEGSPLSSINVQSLNKEKKEQLHISLARIVLQLRRLTFPSFGRLYRADDNELRVSNDIITKDTNIQELEGLEPRRIQQQCDAECDSLPTASKYTETLIRTAYNAFFKGADSVDSDMIDSSLYHLDLFRQHATFWLDPKISPVHFVLSHGDLTPDTILVDESTMTITAVLDWGWSRIVPVQYFTPPLWLKPAAMMPDLAWKHAYDGYISSHELSAFLSVVRAEERRKYKSSALADQWDRAKHDGGFLMAHALEHWHDMDAVAFRYLNARYYGGTSDLDGRVERFLREDPLRGLVVIDMKQRQKDGACYEEEVEGTGTTTTTGSGRSNRLWPGPKALQGSMMLLTTGVGYGLWRLALASARRPPRI